MYQHAWSPQRQSYQNQQQGPIELLLQDRDRIWTAIRSWVASTPKRNGLHVIGGFNAELRPCHPHVGLGLAPHKTSAHKDQRTFQGLVQSLGMGALNTWKKGGRPSTTYMNHRNQPVQIDYALARLPCDLASMHLCRDRVATIVAESGLRHFPITLMYPLPQIPKQHRASTMPTENLAGWQD